MADVAVRSVRKWKSCIDLGNKQYKVCQSELEYKAIMQNKAEQVKLDRLLSQFNKEQKVLERKLTSNITSERVKTARVLRRFESAPNLLSVTWEAPEEDGETMLKGTLLRKRSRTSANTMKKWTTCGDLTSMGESHSVENAGGLLRGIASISVMDISLGDPSPTPGYKKKSNRKSSVKYERSKSTCADGGEDVNFQSSVLKRSVTLPHLNFMDSGSDCRPTLAMSEFCSSAESPSKSVDPVVVKVIKVQDAKPVKRTQIPPVNTSRDEKPSGLPVYQRPNAGNISAAYRPSRTTRPMSSLNVTRNEDSVASAPLRQRSAVASPGAKRIMRPYTATLEQDSQSLVLRRTKSQTLSDSQALKSAGGSQPPTMATYTSSLNQRKSFSGDVCRSRRTDADNGDHSVSQREEHSPDTLVRERLTKFMTEQEKFNKKNPVPECVKEATEKGQRQINSVSIPRPKSAHPAGRVRRVDSIAVERSRRFSRHGHSRSATEKNPPSQPLQSADQDFHTFEQSRLEMKL